MALHPGSVHSDKAWRCHTLPLSLPSAPLFLPFPGLYIMANLRKSCGCSCLANHRPSSDHPLPVEHSSSRGSALDLVESQGWHSSEANSLNGIWAGTRTSGVGEGMGGRAQGRRGWLLPQERKMSPSFQLGNFFFLKECPEAGTG